MRLRNTDLYSSHGVGNDDKAQERIESLRVQDLSWVVAAFLQGLWGLALIKTLNRRRLAYVMSEHGHSYLNKLQMEWVPLATLTVRMCPTTFQVVAFQTQGPNPQPKERHSLPRTVSASGPGNAFAVTSVTSASGISQTWNWKTWRVSADRALNSLLGFSHSLNVCSAPSSACCWPH